MNRWPLFALALLTACTGVDPDDGPGAGGGGGGKSDNPNAIAGVTTAWEARVGGGGDAVVRNVMTLADGNLLATSHFPRWALRLSPSGQFNAPAVPTTVRHDDALFTSSYLHPAHQVWQVSADELVAVAGEGAMFELRGFAADGVPNPAFGTAGVVRLTEASANFNTPVAMEYDAAHGRFLALVVRASQTTTYFNIGPSEIEVVAYDAHTGARSSAGVFTLPPWEDLRVSSPAKLRELIAQPDGSVLVLATNTLYVPSSPGVTDTPVTRWSVFHLVAGAAPARVSLTVSDYSVRQAAFTRVGGGRFDLYLSGGVDHASGESKLVRFSVDHTLAPEVDDLGPAVDMDHDCPAGAATPAMFVYGHSPDRSTKPIQFTAYPKDGEPYSFTSDKPQRCLLDISFGAAGQLYTGTWDTSTGGWTALLTALVPE